MRHTASRGHFQSYWNPNHQIFHQRRTLIVTKTHPVAVVGELFSSLKLLPQTCWLGSVENACCGQNPKIIPHLEANSFCFSGVTGTFIPKVLLLVRLPAACPLERAFCSVCKSKGFLVSSSQDVLNWYAGHTVQPSAEHMASFQLWWMNIWNSFLSAAG